MTDSKTRKDRRIRLLRAFGRASIPVIVAMLAVTRGAESSDAQDRRVNAPEDAELAERQRLLEERNRRTDEAKSTWRSGKFDEAVRLFEEVVVLEKQLLGEDHWDVAGSYYSLAEIHRREGDYESARRYLEEVQRIALSYGRDRWRCADARFFLEELDRLQEMTDEDRALMQEAKSLQREVKQLYERKAVPFMANLAIPKAKRILEIKKEVLGTRHRDYAESLHELGVLSYGAMKFSDAEMYHRAATELRGEILGADHPGFAESQALLAAVYEITGRQVEALPLYEDSLDIFVECAMQGDERGTEDLEAGFELLQNSLLAAFSHYSELEQMVLSARFRSTLDACLSVARTHGYAGRTVYERAFAWKGNVLSRQRRIRLMRAKPEVDQWLSELQEVVSESSAIRLGIASDSERGESIRELDELEQRRERLERKLARESRELSILGVVFGQTSFEQMLSSIPSDAVLLDYLVYDHYVEPRFEGHEWSRENARREPRLSVFVARATGPIDWVDLGPLAPIEKAIERWRRSAGASPVSRSGSGPSTAHPGGAAARIKELLWAPIQERVADSNLVLVSPDGPVARVPLGALPGRRDDTYLLEERSIVVIAVPRLLPDLLEHRVPKEGRPGSEVQPSLLVVGDVDFDGLPWDPDEPEEGETGISRRAAGTDLRGETLLEIGGWGELHGTKEELRDVEMRYDEAFGQGRVSRLDRRRATEGNLKRAVAGKDYVHLATHGFFASSKLQSAVVALPGAKGGSEGTPGVHPGLLSGVVLAGANGRIPTGLEDGILTALELASLDLTATDLLVLSACETGLGVTAAGEGLLGLLRAGQMAGCRTVVGSLWKVDDRTTRDLMVRFYDNLWKKRLGKIEALRDAQLAVLRGELGRTAGDRRGTGVEAGQGNRAVTMDWAAWVLAGDWR